MRGGRFMSRNRPRSTESGVARRSRPSTDWEHMAITRMPTTIGRYQVKAILGEGSFSVVYLAHDPQLDREVAVKTIHFPEHLPTKRRVKLTQALLKEARLAARLGHPGIVLVHDAGKHLDHPFVVLERIRGKTLAQHLSPGPFEETLRIMAELIEAVAYAHDRNIIHRDLKPGNIMVQPDGHARVMDFGIARVLKGPATGNRHLAGTPRYMAPEQILGEAVDTRCDVFALGVIFYEMLSGRHPFPQQHFDQLREAISQKAPPPIHSLVPELPATAVSVVERALRKNPEHRFPSARQMAEAIKPLKHQIEAHEDSPEDGEPQPASAAARSEIIDFMFKRMQRKGDFPATQQYVSAVVNAAHSSNSSAYTIAQAVLKDFALTNRILRMVNSPYYRGRGGSISTISRAVVILGIDTVISLAGTLSIFEHFHNQDEVQGVKQQAVHALLTAMQAREIAESVDKTLVEEAFICGMLHHLGRLIVAYYFPEEHEAIQELIDEHALGEVAASRRVMRLSYAELGQGIAHRWHLPELVEYSIGGLNPSHTGGLHSSVQKLQGIVSFAHDLSAATLNPDADERREALFRISRQYEGRINLKPHQLKPILDTSIKNACDLTSALRVNLQQMGLAEPRPMTAEPPPPGSSDWERSTADDDAFDAPVQPFDVMDEHLEDSHPDDEEFEAARREDFLMKTIGEITSSLMTDFEINDILLMVLEGMYRGVGCRNVFLALVDTAYQQVRCRFCLGENAEPLREAFSFPLDEHGRTLASCLQDRKEILYAQLTESQKRTVLPEPMRPLLDAGSMLMLPVIVREKPIGIFLAVRGTHQPPIGNQDIRDLRTLANQATLAIHQSLGESGKALRRPLS